MIPAALRNNPVAITGRTVREMFAVRAVSTVIPGTPGTPETLGPAEWAGGTWTDPSTGRRYTVRRVGPLGAGGSWVHPLTGALIPIEVIPGTPGTPETTVTTPLSAPVTLGIAASGGAVSISPAGVTAAALSTTPVAVAVTRLSESGGRLVGVPCLGLASAGTDWRAGVAALSWAVAGLPWAGFIEHCARAGLWVRRYAWASGRMIRCVAGAGTTRAVAVRETGEVVTAEDFSGPEWFGDDWTLADIDGEPPAVDVTDWAFVGGAKAQAFCVQGSVAPEDDGGSDSPAWPAVPAKGRGFVYADNGRTTLVPAETVEGIEWRP